MGANNTFTLDGLDEVRATLRDVAPKEANNIMRATIRAITVSINKDAKANAPVDSGAMKASLKVRSRKSKPDNPIFEIWAGAKGATFDAYYWRFVEYGTKDTSPRPFVRPAVDAARAKMSSMLRDEFGKKWEKALAKKRKSAAKIPEE